MYCFFLSSNVHFNGLFQYWMQMTADTKLNYKQGIKIKMLVKLMESTCKMHAKQKLKCLLNFNSYGVKKRWLELILVDGIKMIFKRRG